jgi:predicted aspartyl protease
VGTFKVPIEIGNQEGQLFERFEALVDTGSTYTVIPASVLNRLNVRPHRRSVFELADGSRREWDMARTWVKLDGQLEQTLVVFGAETDELILGAVTLEEFLLAPDPVRGRLMPVPALLMSLMQP